MRQYWRTVVVESSSGNLGIGLAQACRYLGLRFVCVVDPRTNPQNVAIMRALGAEVRTVESVDPATGEYLPARKRYVRDLVDSLPDAYCPDQYANPRNAWAHRTTMREIVEALDGRLDYLLVTVSSAGTLLPGAELTAAPITQTCRYARPYLPDGLFVVVIKQEGFASSDLESYQAEVYSTRARGLLFHQALSLSPT